MIELTLIYSDETTWLVGGFNTLGEAEAWLAEEMTRPYWDPATTYQTVDTEPAP